MKKIKIVSLSLPVIATLIALGPIGHFIMDYYERDTSRVLELFITSILLTIFVTWTWIFYFQNRNEHLDFDEKDED